MPQKKLIKKIENTEILEVIGDAVSIQDTNYKIIYQNKIHIKLVGKKVGEFCYSAYQGKDHVCEGCHLAMSFKDGKVHPVERSRVTDNGVKYSENTVSLLRDSNGQIVAGIEVVRDITVCKNMEEKILKNKDNLELNVKERTAELEQLNETLLNEISKRKKIEENLRFTERELIAHLNELKEANTALKVLLQQREDDKKNFEKNILATMKHLVLPYIAKLKKNRSMSEELTYLNVLELNLNEIISPFSSNLSSNYYGFTPKEIQIANLVKDGQQDKDIAELMNISLDTAKTHRKNIRKKLGIYSKRINLRTHLMSIDNR